MNLNSQTQKLTPEQDDGGIWLSIGDLMSVLLMIFALLFISALVQITEFEESKESTRIIIIKGINDALQHAGIEVQADTDSGDISILDLILFDQNQYQLKPSGKAFLKKFIPIYADVIFQNEETANEVARIVIEGHSSSEGYFTRNMELSVLRANSVATYIRWMAFEHKNDFFNKIIVSGRGPIEADQNSVDSADRKVKFKFQFKDESFLGNFNEVTPNVR
ncbi:OmpA family protein [Paraferrimonas sp. SM1919]|uniref:OmpA/MotB family protein n=1 Tax=Paraferrimonas sp. SM1919 TaxID=2662263 RepID=UPI0013D1C93B|nr:OmpA family protein [Paraferrimonas sp. SM1919]